MRPLFALVLSMVLSACQSMETPAGPCRLPDQVNRLGAQQWQSPGARTWDSEARCLAKGGIYSSSALPLLQSQVRQQADQGSVHAQHQLGLWALNSQPPNYEVARQHFLQAWQRGYPPAAWYLSRMARLGLGQAPDPLAATNWMQRAAGDQVLVAKSQLDHANLTQQHLTQTLANLQGELAKTRLQQDLAPKTPLFRFDLGGAGGCGQTLQWRAFGDSGVGLSLAMDAFERDYRDQGWLWLDVAGTQDALTDQVLQEILQASPSWLVVSGYPAPAQPTHHPRLYGQPSKVTQYGPTLIQWQCDES